MIVLILKYLYVYIVAENTENMKLLAVKIYIILSHLYEEFLVNLRNLMQQKAFHKN